MAKKPPTLQQRYILEHVRETKEKVVEDSEKSRKDQQEIGCTLIRLWTKKVKIIEWHDRWKSVVVEVDGNVSRYQWPFNIYNPFINLEIIEDCGYLDKFSNGEEYVIDGKRYGAKEDVVWAGTKRYLSSVERAKFGSFKKFLAGKEFISKKSII